VKAKAVYPNKIDRLQGIFSSAEARGKRPVDNVGRGPRVPACAGHPLTLV
jgi:hypothetical protein